MPASSVSGTSGKKATRSDGSNPIILQKVASGTRLPGEFWLETTVRNLYRAIGFILAASTAISSD